MSSQITKRINFLNTHRPIGQNNVTECLTKRTWFCLLSHVVDGVLAIGLHYRGIRDVHPRDLQHHIRVQASGRDQVPYRHRTGTLRVYLHS